MDSIGNVILVSPPAPIGDMEVPPATLAGFTFHFPLEGAVGRYRQLCNRVLVHIESGKELVQFLGVIAAFDFLDFPFSTVILTG